MTSFNAGSDLGKKLYTPRTYRTKLSDSFFICYPRSSIWKKVKKSKSHLRERNRGLKHYRESNQDPSFPLCSPLFLLLFEIVKVIMLAILLDNEGRSYAVLSWHINRLILITLMTQNGYQPYKPRARWKRNICNKMNIIYPEHRIQGW
jgi:hypothetical protein